MLQEIRSEHEVGSRSPRGLRAIVQRRPVLSRVFLILAGTVVGLALAEIVVRIGVAVMHRDPLIVSDARAGWVLRPNLRGLIRGGGGGQYVISTDEEGHRITPPGRRACRRTSAHRSSWWAIPTFSPWARMTPKSLPGFLARDMPVNVVNLGFSAMGPIKNS